MRRERWWKIFAKAYSKRIDAASWMAPETKKEAQDKLAALVAKIGYPDT